MKEKERVKEMNEIIASERAEEAKREEGLVGVENTIKKDDEKYDASINDVEKVILKDEEAYDAKINKAESEILEDQDRVGTFGKSGS